MTKRITFSTSLEGEIAEPASEKSGALVVIQEWFGVNDTMKKLCDRFAGAGFIAMAPDLFHGKIATDDAEAARMMQALDKPRAVSEIGQAVEFLSARGKVGVVGFCLGGALTFHAALDGKKVSAAVPFYGLPSAPPAKFRGLKVPIQAHFAKKDDWAKASVAEEIKTAVNEGGGSMELFVYDAGHAFMREGDAAKYDAASAKVAWERAIGFLKKHLA